MARRDQQRSDISDAAEIGSTLTSSVRRRPRPPGGLRSDLTLPQQVWVLAKWPLLEQFMAFLVGFVDTALAGHLPENAVASTNAIGVTSYLMWLMGLLQGSVGVGALAVIARAVGGRHRREANAAVGQSMGIALIWGSAIGVFFFALAEPAGYVFGLRGEALAFATVYLRWVSVGIPMMSALFVGGACLRGAGDFRTPFIVMVVVNTVNVLVSLLLVVGPEPIGGMGLEGIAIGTAAAWTIGGMLMLATLVRGRGGIRLHAHRLRPHKRMSLRIIRISTPSLTEYGLHWVGNAVIVYIVGHLATEPNALGAHIIAIRLEALSFLPGVAFSQAASTLVGQHLGAAAPSSARSAGWACWGFGAAVMTFMGLLFIAIPGAFVRLMTDQPEFLDAAAQVIRIAGFAQVGFATAIVLGGAMRGAGDTGATMLLSLSSTFALRLPLAWLLGVELGYGLTGVWIALSAELMCRGALFLGRFVHGGWARVEV